MGRLHMSNNIRKAREDAMIKCLSIPWPPIDVIPFYLENMTDEGFYAYTHQRLITREEFIGYVVDALKEIHHE